jgi:imidazolonepropionase-like amidohydrolase
LNPSLPTCHRFTVWFCKVIIARAKTKKVPMIEMELMQQTGMVRMQILVAAMMNGAFDCGKSGDLGTVEPGKSADTLVVRGQLLVHRFEAVTARDT